MKAILVRIGIDHSYGSWNAPADPGSRRFLYVPIPEGDGTRFHQGCRCRYSTFVPAIEDFASDLGLDPVADLRWPRHLERCSMHLDPDFEALTYGDIGDRRGSHIREMGHGDIIVFYAGLRSVLPDDPRLIYALVGMYVIDEVVTAADVPARRRNENAHTRRLRCGRSDIVVRALPGSSGRFSNFVPIGEFRNGAYRVREDLLHEWGGLTVHDGFIQRSARPPRFVNPKRFLKWLNRQDFELINENNPAGGTSSVVLVLLRQPKMSDPKEMRTDPFWEFGSFGCTHCHERNLMHIGRADDLEGLRFGFAQGGPLGIRLVKLTPPVFVVTHRNCVEVRWTPETMPFRYDTAPLLVDNRGRTDFPSVKKFITDARCLTWVSRFSSKFRSRRQLVPDSVARELVSVYAERIKGAEERHELAENYVEALPHQPPHPDTNRLKTYKGLLSRASKAQAARSKCVKIRGVSRCPSRRTC